jgi:hypothetical protein
VVGIGSGHRPSTPIRKTERESTRAPSVSPNGGRGSPSSARAPKSSDRSEQQRGGHYRGITFEEILPPHLITTAPPPEVEQPKRSSTQYQKRGPGPKTSSMAAPPSIKRSYQPVKRPGGKFGFRDTARALMRSFTSGKRKRNSRGRGSYEVVV